ncbi:MAG: long-chain fatty acid--CoA ligase [Kofleriaceae bacterium]|nr:long-chain fatty acid--CoA ligase [Kofleriaceae bacterium]MBP9168576.1 long-chain fatty acid--CoA ligase [Kofleriaceae bacterium]MBP9859224.1 long-chain fatty acid--CoA ligase [Kofleriaceae bacterium]
MDVTGLTDLRAAPRIALDAAAATPDRVRFQVRRTDGGWTPVTWREFGRQIRAVAAGLIGRGIAPGDRVAVFGTNSVAWAAAALGAQAVGATMVPIYPASTGEAARYVLTHADCRAVFVATGQRPALAAAELPEIRAIGLDDGTWSDFLAGGEHADRADPSIVDARLAAVELDRPGLMLYTSGTSGPPKGVPLTHRNVGENGAAWLRANAPLLERGDRDVLWLPMSHIFGWGEMTNGNLLGWESWMCTPAEVMAVFPEVAPQVFMSVPAYWEKLVRAVDAAASSTELADRRAAFGRITGGRLRFCLSGGAGLSRTIKDELLALGALVIEGYGLTETSPTLTLNRPDRYRFDSVGLPLDNVELRLADDGEIQARGPNVFAGYHADPDATAGAFTADGWFCTGDIGRFTDDGFLQIVDRKKDILVTAGGKNVPPANLEARFVGAPAIDRVVVYGDGKPYLVAAVWLTADGDAAAAAAAVERVNRDLAKFETIKKFWIADEPLTIEAGLLTSSLKLRRKAVYQRYRDRFEALYG